jgi:hypothetical protein
MKTMGKARVGILTIIYEKRKLKIRIRTLKE